MRFIDFSRRSPLISVAEFRKRAQQCLPKLLYDFLISGAFDELTLKKNSSDFQRLQLRKRVLKDVAEIDTSIELFGERLTQPVILAPIALVGAYARRGEVLAAKAAEKAGVPFTLSTVAICSIEEVQRETEKPFWFQFYPFKEKRDSLELLNRAKEAKCPVLVLTVDVPVLGPRHGKTSGSLFDYLCHPGWLWRVGIAGRPLSLGNLPSSAPSFSNLASMRKWMRSQLSASVSWKDLEWIRANWSGKILLKGVLDVADAKLAAEHGIDGIVVSNHGGRHMDSLPSTIEVLPAIVEAVKGRLAILLDSGVTSGIDIAKALALGAKACMIGRAWVYGLAANQEKGVAAILDILQHELKISMASLGTLSIDEIDSRVLFNSEKVF